MRCPGGVYVLYGVLRTERMDQGVLLALLPNSVAKLAREGPDWLMVQRRRAPQIITLTPLKSFIGHGLPTVFKYRYHHPFKEG